MIARGLQSLLSIASGFGSQRKLIILIYHRVLDAPDFMYPQQIDIDKFNWQMALLASRFNVLPLPDALAQLKSGCLPPRAVCITFDDGYADNYINALPILKHYSLPATFFIVSGMLNQDRMWSDDIVETIRNYPEPLLDLSALGLGCYTVATPAEKARAAVQLVEFLKYFPFSERAAHCRAIANLTEGLPKQLMLTTEQLKSLSEQGMEIGGHSVNHPILKNLTVTDGQHEILACKIQLEEILGKNVRYFAYPNGKLNGDYELQHSTFVEECGYEAALSTDWGSVSIASDRFQLPRFTPWDGTQAKFMLRMAYMYRK